MEYQAKPKRTTRLRPMKSDCQANIESFTKTAGVFSPSTAKRFIFRLESEGIAYIATEYSENRIRVKVRPDDLENAIEMQPVPVSNAPSTKAKPHIPARFLLSIPIGAFVGTWAFSYVQANGTVGGLVGVLFVTTLIEILWRQNSKSNLRSGI